MLRHRGSCRLRIARPLSLARLIVGFAPRASYVHDDSAGSVRVIELGADKGSLELRSQGVRSEDGTNWYWADVDDAVAEEVAAQVAKLTDVASAYVQPVGGPP